MWMFVFIVTLNIARGTDKGIQNFVFTIGRKGEDLLEVKAALIKEFDNPLIHACFAIAPQSCIEQTQGLLESDFHTMVAKLKADREARQRQYDVVAAENEAKEKARLEAKNRKL